MLCAGAFSVSTAFGPTAGGVDANGADARPQFWYEDNNMRRAGGYPPDFHEMFTRPETWRQLRGHIDVYYIRGNTLKNIFNDYGEDFLRDHFVRVLNESGIPIAIDNPTQYKENITRLRRVGATVTHIALQSTLSKCKPDEAPARVPQAVAMVSEIHQAFPDIKIGLIDATPTKGRPYQDLYRSLVAGVKEAGARLDFIHLDCPSDQADEGRRVSWEKVKEVERFVQDELGLEFGFICVSAGDGKTSDKGFYERVTTIPDRYIREGGAPDHFILMSWFPHPARALPENAPEGEYPMTKVGLDLARNLEAWAAREGGGAPLGGNPSH